VIGNNPEATGASSVLDKQKDEYMLSPCNVDRWVVLELCDHILVQHFRLANFELFSSMAQSVRVSVSERFPSKDWSVLATFDLEDVRSVQSFTIEVSI